MKTQWICGDDASAAGRGLPGQETGGRRTPGVGIIGGTFDPPHIGHLIIAEAARQALDLDKVFFVPASAQPHKLDRQVTPPLQRWEMVRRAIADNPAFEASDLELRRPGPSYTADTVIEIMAQHPGRPLFFICGADALVEMVTWHRPDRILAGAVVAVAGRPGVPGGKTLRQAARHLTGLFGGTILGFGAPMIDVSSTMIREIAARGESVRYMVPEGVLAYIRQSGLYLAGIDR